jgi:hypothetical protein
MAHEASALAAPATDRMMLRFRQGIQLTSPGRAVALGFPGARLSRLVDAPPRCPTCGAPWRRMAASLACLTCPTELYVAVELRRLETGLP